MARTVARLGQKQGASAWGMKLRADPLGIALINGTSAQGYELDDCHEPCIESSWSRNCFA